MLKLNYIYIENLKKHNKYDKYKHGICRQQKKKKQQMVTLIFIYVNIRFENKTT